MTVIWCVRGGKFIYKHAETDLVHLKYMQVILSPTLQKSTLFVFYRIMSIALVALLLLAAISMADKFDEENYGVKVYQAHVMFF